MTSEGLIARTLAFYILILTLLLVNMYYITNPIINLVNIIVFGVISYLYFKLLNDVNKVI